MPKTAAQKTRARKVEQLEKLGCSQDETGIWNFASTCDTDELKAHAFVKFFKNASDEERASMEQQMGL
jgi:hypothetical protein